MVTSFGSCHRHCTLYYCQYHGTMSSKALWGRIDFLKKYSRPSFFDIRKHQLIWKLLQKYFSKTSKKESWIRLHEDFDPIVRFYVAPKWPSVLYAMLPLHKFGFDRKTMGFLSMITCDVNCNFFAITYRNWISNSFDPDLFFR